jgi:hypothetical protein
MDRLPLRRVPLYRSCYKSPLRLSRVAVFIDDFVVRTACYQHRCNRIWAPIASTISTTVLCSQSVYVVVFSVSALIKHAIFSYLPFVDYFTS